MRHGISLILAKKQPTSSNGVAQNDSVAMQVTICNSQKDYYVQPQGKYLHNEADNPVRQ